MLKIIKGDIEAIEQEMSELRETHRKAILERQLDMKLEKERLKEKTSELQKLKKLLRIAQADLKKASKKGTEKDVSGIDFEVAELKVQVNALESFIQMQKSSIERKEAAIANHRTFYNTNFYRKLPVWINAPQSYYEPVLMDWNLLQQVAKVIRKSQVELEIIRDRNTLVIHYFTGYSKGAYTLNGLEGDYEKFKNIPTAEPA